MKTDAEDVWVRYVCMTDGIVLVIAFIQVLALLLGMYVQPVKTSENNQVCWLNVMICG